MNMEGPGKQEKKPATIAEMRPIEESRNIPILGKEAISKLVETPLVSACEILYDKNIQTLASSANAKDIAIGYGHLIINFDTLSEENQELAKRLGEVDEYDGMQAVLIKIPISETSTVEDIRAQVDAIAEAFLPQSGSWIETRTLEDFQRIYGPNLTEEDLRSWSPEEGGWYYDSNSNRYYPSEELYKKATGSL